jgi:hypothetical protein
VIDSAAPAAVSAIPVPQTDAHLPAAEETNDEHCVSSLPADDHSSAGPAPTLADAIEELLDSLPRQRYHDQTGEITRWPITLRRVLAALAKRYPAQWPVWQRTAKGTYRRVRAERVTQQYAVVCDLSAQALD